MRRVSVIGSVGSGKSTFARALADKLGVPYVELDTLHWDPGWTAADDALMRGRVRRAIAGDAWVIDGNYWRKIGGLVWTRADTVIWLDPPWLLTFLRVLARTIRRASSHAELFNGNRETLREAFFSRESILLFAIRTARGRRRVGEERLARPEYAHLKRHHFRSQAAADRWLAAVPAELEPQPH